MKQALVALLFLLIYFGCRNNKQYFKEPQTVVKKNDIVGITDTVVLQHSNMSYVGFSYVEGDNIIFFDKKFDAIFKFNIDGSYIEPILTKGRGPKEYSGYTIEEYNCFSDSMRLIYDGVTLHVFDKNWHKVSAKTLEWAINFDRNELLKNPDPNLFAMYDPEYLELNMRSYNDKVFMNLDCEHPTYNRVISTDYVKNAAILVLFTPEKSRVEKLLGRISPYYQRNSHPQFWIHHYDVANNGDFYVNAEADSVIYHYDKNYNIINAYGVKGRNMVQNYANIYTMADYQANAENDRETKGRYTWLEYIDELGLLFRSYTKSKEAETDGLQIYKNNTLIADIDVPKGFKVDSYQAPYLYSKCVIDEMNEKVFVYRLKMKL